MGILQKALEQARISAPKKNRSKEWTRVRKEHLKEHSSCEACGQTTVLEVHHIIPFSDSPELELDPNNLITLCESAKGGIVCHLAIGHLGNYQSYNKNVIEDSKIWKEKIKNRP